MQIFILLFVIITTLLSGCTDEFTGSSVQPGNAVTIMLDIAVDEEINGNSRQGYNRRTTGIELYTFDDAQQAKGSALPFHGIIYQFDSQSGRLYHKTEIFDLNIPSAGSGNITLNATLRAGTNQTIVCIAAPTTKELADIQSLHDLEAKYFEKQDLYFQDQNPLLGRLDHVEVTTEGFFANGNKEQILLKRIGVRLNIRLEVGGVAKFIPSNIVIGNVAKRYYLMEYHQETDNIYSNYHINTSGNLTNEFTLFLPENKAGSNPRINNVAQKTKSNAMYNATYIEIQGIYYEKQIAIRIYPGANATSDFNLIRNHFYRIGVKINSIDPDDPRIEIIYPGKFVIEIVDKINIPIESIRKVRLQKNNSEQVFSYDNIQKESNKLIFDQTDFNTNDILSYIEFRVSDSQIFFDDCYHKINGDKIYYSEKFRGIGNGTKADPYEVFSQTTLNSINKFCTPADSNKCFTQVKNIDLNSSYSSISGSAGFYGEYNGSFFDITFNNITTSNHNFGIFKSVEKGAFIRNIITHGNSSSHNMSQTGFIASILNGGSIHRCINFASNSTEQGIELGGIIGRAYSGLISECANYGSVRGHSSIGGIIGCTTTVGIVRITNCKNNGQVTASQINHNFLTGGGILGYSTKTANNLAITSCLNTGKIQDNYSRRGGGLIGYTTKISPEQISLNYYLDTSATYGIGYASYSDRNVKSETTNTLQSPEFIQTLDNGFNIWKYNPNGYPKLRFEK